jgi:Zn-dependent peptidase ImmA (M78 family)
MTKEETKLPDFQKAVTEAEKLIDEIGYDAPPISPLEAAEYLGISVMQLDTQPLTAETTPENALLTKSSRLDAKKGQVFVNAQQPPKHQLFTIALQLGYYIFTEHTQTTRGRPKKHVLPRGRELFNPTDKLGKEAYHFAANLTVPEDMLQRYRDQPNTVLSTIFGVPLAVISYRLNT